MRPTLSEEEQSLIGQVIHSNRPANLSPLFRYYEQEVAKFGDLEIKRFALNYPLTHKRLPFLEIRSKNLEERDAVLIKRDGAHGEERYVVMASAFAFPTIARYAQKKGVGLAFWILGNPYGFQDFYRYNKEYYLEEKKRRIDFHGTNDAARFRLGNHRWVDTVRGGRATAKKIADWRPVEQSEVCVEARMPITRLENLQQGGRLSFQRQRIAFFDSHEDHIIDGKQEDPIDGLPGRGFYFTAYGEAGRYQPIVQMLNKRIPVLSNRWVDTGDGQKGRTNRVGQVYKIDGTLGCLLHLLGAEESLTVDFREETTTAQMKWAVWHLSKSLIDQIAK